MIGYLTLFTSRARNLVQDLRRSKHKWDAVIETGKLDDQWCKWESERCEIPQVCLPICYTSRNHDPSQSQKQLHIFCGASECAYGSVAYLRSADSNGDIAVSFVAAKSRVAPEKLLSMHRLELSAALTGAQLAAKLHKTSSLMIQDTILWSDSTNVSQSPYNNWESLVKATMECLDGATISDQIDEVELIVKAETLLFQQIQLEWLPDGIASLREGKEITCTSKRIEHNPKYDPSDGMVGVGGRLRQAEGLPDNVKHPKVLHPKHPITRLIIKDFDEILHHYGPECSFAKVR
ncbi:uncharacterized protein [Haliotis cracherodii]|uniref:uncharacterized protein n=1 Tax=Haliotis cracherodii TaxID=6455 RepID=UPI0039E82900